MTSEELVKAGQLTEALADLQGQVRAKPEDARLRTFLFQLHCVMGSWQKALTQLEGLTVSLRLVSKLPSAKGA